MRATLTDERCTYEGPSSANAGRFTIEVANDSRSFGGFFLAAAANDTEVDDLQTMIDRLLRRYRGSGESRLRAMDADRRIGDRPVGVRRRPRGRECGAVRHPLPRGAGH